MCRLHHDPFGALRFRPAAKDAPTGKDELVDGVPLNHGELKVSIEGGGRNPFPCFADAGLRALWGVACWHVRQLSG